MSSDFESDSEHSEFVSNFFQLIQAINNYFHRKAQKKRTAKFIKKANARRKIGQINFKMPQSLDQNVSEIVCFNKNQAEKLVKAIRNKTKNLSNSQVEPLICNVHKILNDIEWKLYILRKIQKQIFLNIFQNNKKMPPKLLPKTSCLHVYLAEKIYADIIQDEAICQKIHVTSNIVIPKFTNIIKQGNTN